MKGRAHLVSQAVEQALEKRVQAPFAPVVRTVERTPFGIAAIDEVVQGGAPLGEITELVGNPCSGRTTAAIHLLSRFIAEGNVCAWVDVADAFSPTSAAANGIDLQRLLWVRCGASESGAAVSEMYPEVSAASVGSSLQAAGGNSPHPRTESRDMPQAIQAMLGAHGGLLEHQMRRERKAAGGPRAANRPLMARAVDRQEQTPTDRMPPRREVQLVVPACCSEPMPRRAIALPFAGKPRVRRADDSPMRDRGARTDASWKALDQALRATDLLLTNGGFAAIVLDLGSTPPEFAWRIPLATWFRYRAACERSRCSLVLLTQHPCARSSAGLVVRMQPASLEADGAVVTVVRFQAEAERSRFAERHAQVVPIRKPPQAERAGFWKSEAVWG
jgi:recombination protein RecA